MADTAVPDAASIWKLTLADDGLFVLPNVIDETIQALLVLLPLLSLICHLTLRIWRLTCGGGEPAVAEAPEVARRKADAKETEDLKEKALQRAQSKKAMR